MAIRLAQMEELKIVHALVKDATKQMDEQGIPQWDEIYPAKEILNQDIERQEMYVVEQGGRAVGIVVINEEQPPEYAAIPWICAGRALVVHRLTVAPSHQRSGLATRLMDFVEDTATTEHYDCIRLDAFVQNPAAFSLYEKRGYRRAGMVLFRKGRFYCYERAIKVPGGRPEPGAAGDDGSSR